MQLVHGLKHVSSAVQYALIVILGLIFLGFTSPVHAAQVTLSWNANNPAPDGYRLYQRNLNNMYDYSRPAWTGSAASCTVKDLNAGTTYYFIVRAFSGTDESGDSNEVSYQSSPESPPPESPPPVSPPPVSPPPVSPENLAPVAHAGVSQVVTPESIVVLDGSGSYDPEKFPLIFSWRQSAGPQVTLSGANSTKPSFTASNSTAQTVTLAFELTVMDHLGLSSKDTCLISIAPRQTTDRDGDGIADDNDAFPDDPKEWSDTDHDGVGNNRDTDDDNDGMPDEWELTYRLNPLIDDAAEDADGDGMTNLAEYMADSNPMVPDVNRPPIAPEMIYPQNGDRNVSLRPVFYSSGFKDPDPQDTHVKTQWRICQVQSGRVVLERYTSRKDLYTLRVPRLILKSSTYYTCSVRYFDNDGNASDWSPMITFRTILSRRDLNDDGLADTQETTAETDINRDGIRDTEQSFTLKCLQGEDSQYRYGISNEACKSDIRIDSVEIVTLQEIAQPPEKTIEMPHGAMGFLVETKEPGQEATIKIYFSHQLPDTGQWMRYDEIEGWRDCSGRIQQAADGFCAQYSIKDGDENDADGIANGVIVDLIGPYQGSADENNNNDNDSSLSEGDGQQSGSSAEGSACFIQSLTK